MTELPKPLMVRRTVCFGEAVYDGEAAVEEIVARRGPGHRRCARRACRARIPVLVDPEARSAEGSLPRLCWSTGSWRSAIPARPREDAPWVIALGPGFTAGVDSHAVVETQRGASAGPRSIGRACATRHRHTRRDRRDGRRAVSWPASPTDGILLARTAIGDRVATGQDCRDGRLAASGSPPRAPRPAAHGVRRGLIRSGTRGGSRVRWATSTLRRTCLLLHYLRQIAGGRRRRARSDSGKLMD